MVTAVTVKLAWTAPGDDGAEGTASAYDLRYALTPITAETWDAAIQVEGTPAPKLHGSAESYTVTGLEQATGYYFALKTIDNAGNGSTLSNAVSKSTASLVRLTSTPHVPSPVRSEGCRVVPGWTDHRVHGGLGRGDPSQADLHDASKWWIHRAPDV